MANFTKNQQQQMKVKFFSELNLKIFTMKFILLIAWINLTIGLMNQIDIGLNMTLSIILDLISVFFIVSIALLLFIKELKLFKRVEEEVKLSR